MKKSIFIIALTLICPRVFAATFTMSRVSPTGHLQMTITNFKKNTTPRGYYRAAKLEYNHLQMSCDDFVNAVSALGNWPWAHLNLALYSDCSQLTGNSYSTAEVTYTVDLPYERFLSEYVAFLQAVNQSAFLGEKLQFFSVVKIKVDSDLLVGNEDSQQTVTTLHEAVHWNHFRYEDQVVNEYNQVYPVIQQGDLSVFLKYVEYEFGKKEKATFQAALSNSNYVFLAQYFTLILKNGESAPIWLGWGDEKDCGSIACYQ